MKRLLCLILLLSLLCSLWACVSQPKPSEAPSVTESTATEPSTEESTAEPEPEIWEDISTLLPPDATLSAMTLGQDSIYLLVQDLNDRHSLIVRGLEGGDASSYALDAEFLYPQSFALLPQGELAIVAPEGEDCRVLCLSTEGALLREYPVENWEPSSFSALDRQQSALWYDGGEGQTYRLCLTDGSTSSLSHEGFLYAALDGKLFYSGTDTPRCYDTNREEFLDLSWLGSSINFYEHGGTCTPSALLSEFAPAAGTVFLDYREPEQLWLAEAVGQVFYYGPYGRAFSTLSGGEGCSLCAFDPAQGLELARWELPKGLDFFPYTQADNGSSLLLHGCIGGEEGLYLWRYSLEAARPLEHRSITPETLPDLIAELSGEIEARSGIMVHAQPGELPPESFEYIFDPDYDPFQAYLSLLEVERILELFPQEVLQGLCGSQFDALHLYFTESFIPNSSYAISDASGLHYSSGRTQIVVLSVSAPWSLPHELMHVMDDRLFELGDEDYRRDYLGYWEAINPPDFDYYWEYDYEDRRGSQDWTWGVSEEEENSEVWFIDSYAKTYPWEDRARVFEHLFTREIDYFYGNPRLQEKAVYLCSMLRALFGYEEALWERGYDIPPLESYEEAVLEYTSNIVPVG